MRPRFFDGINACLERCAWIETVYVFRARIRELEHENERLRKRCALYERVFERLK